MSWLTWKSIKECECERIGEEVSLEVQLVYPAGFMPDQPPRVLAHRCSKGLECNWIEKPACVWAGTSPGYDPFA
jgi:hypothetical protein